MKRLILIVGILLVSGGIFTKTAEAKSYIKSYTRSSGTYVRPYIRYKADEYKFNNYVYRPDRGYRR